MPVRSVRRPRPDCHRSLEPTLFPTSTEEPSGAQARLWALPRPLTSLMHVLVLTSQNLTTPSLLTLQSSASLTGLKAIFSIPAKCPLSSVENRTLGFSGFPAARPGQLVALGDYVHACAEAMVLTNTEGFV